MNVTKEAMRRGEGGHPAGASILVAAVLVAQTWFMGWAVVGLDVALVVSYAIWVSRPGPAAPARVLPMLLVAVLVQLAHLAEEVRAGFQRAFPALSGYTWEDRRFLTFNVVWLAVFAASAVAIAYGRRLGSLPALFLALGGGIANGLAHLALAARAEGYFPARTPRRSALPSACSSSSASWSGPQAARGLSSPPPSGRSTDVPTGIRRYDGSSLLRRTQ